MGIYTRTGDRGETDLPDGARVAKDAAVLEVCGTLDELNAQLGLARCHALPEGTDALLEQIQRRLFDVGAELVGRKAAYGKGDSPIFADHAFSAVSAKIGTVPGPRAVGPEDVTALEQLIDQHEARLGQIETFILPAGNRASAALHLARAVCRRAERRLVAFAREHPRTAFTGPLSYLNRLGDLLFVLARVAGAEAGVPDAHCQRRNQ